MCKRHQWGAISQSALNALSYVQMAQRRAEEADGSAHAECAVEWW
jgi:hypothetical protein